MIRGQVIDERGGFRISAEAGSGRGGGSRPGRFESYRAAALARGLGDEDLARLARMADKRRGLVDGGGRITLADVERCVWERRASA